MALAYHRQSKVRTTSFYALVRYLFALMSVLNVQSIVVIPHTYRGFIHGFMTRQEADRRLNCSGLRPGTFLLRFSESVAGCVTIRFVFLFFICILFFIQFFSQLNSYVTAVNDKNELDAVPTIKHYTIKPLELSLQMVLFVEKKIDFQNFFSKK